MRLVSEKVLTDFNVFFSNTFFITIYVEEATFAKLFQLLVYVCEPIAIWATGTVTSRIYLNLISDFRLTIFKPQTWKRGAVRLILYL